MKSLQCLRKAKQRQLYIKGEEKHQAELKLCKEAEIVATIGPKLAEAISAPLRSYRKDQQVINR